MMRPTSEAELAEIIRTAHAPLLVQGGGTRTLGSPQGEVLSTTGLSGIELYEPGALTIVVRAGTPLSQVEAALAAENQRLPFEAPDLRRLLERTGHSTIGGVVAANASGPRRVQAGACRDSLIGVRFVTGEGVIVKNGGRVMKNVTGYDLVKLMAGSCGGLGVLTEVSFKVLPTPAASATVILRGLDDARAVAAMSAALGSPFEVNGAAHLPGEATLLRIEGLAASVTYRAQALVRHLAEFGAAEIMESAEVWSGIRDVSAFHDKPGDVWRLSVKPSDGPGIVDRMGADAVVYDWGGGLIWALCPPGTDLRARIGEFQGHATRVRGQGAEPPAFQPEAPALAALTKGIRQRFDPRGLFASAVA